MAVDAFEILFYMFCRSKGLDYFVKIGLVDTKLRKIQQHGSMLCSLVRYFGASPSK